jgi:polar amino acid transport system substrate-binding protein
MLKFFIQFIFIVNTLFFSLYSWAFTLKEAGVLSVCSYSEFKPISYGNGLGYEADLLKAIAASWHVKIKFYPEAIFKDLWLFPSRTDKHCDVAIGGFTPAAYRIKQGTAFSILTTKFDQSLLIRKEDFTSGKITSYDSFKNTTLKIGVVPGTTGKEYAQYRAIKSNLPLTTLVAYKSESQLLAALLDKKIDAIARGEVGNEYQQLTNNQLITIAKQNFCEGFSIAVDKNNPELLKALNQAILQATHNGRITYAQWLKSQHIFNESMVKTSHP